MLNMLQDQPCHIYRRAHQRLRGASNPDQARGCPSQEEGGVGTNPRIRADLRGLDLLGGPVLHFSTMEGGGLSWKRARD